MTEVSLSRRLATRLAGEMAAGIAATAQHEVLLDPAQAESGPGLRLTFKVSGTQTGTAMVWFPNATGANAARVVVGGDKPVSPDDVSRILREAAAMAIGRVTEAPEFTGLEIAVSAVVPASAPNGASHHSFEFADGSVGYIGATATLTATESRDTGGNLELVLDVELPLVVRFGRTVMSLKALSGLGPGSIVDMGRSPDDPVELLVSDKVVAYGEVVIVDGNYGLRITDLVSKSDRMRAVESR